MCIRDRFQIQPQRPPDGAGDLGHELHVQGPPGQIVVPVKGKHLGLVRVTVVKGVVQDAVRIVKIGRPHNGVPGQSSVLPHRLPVGRGIGRECPVKILVDLLQDVYKRQRPLRDWCR